MQARQFIAELKARGVYRVAAFYSAGAWALLQVVDIVFPIVGLPDSGVTMVLAAAALGFPVALCLAWWFDLTAEGVVEAPPVDITSERAALSPLHAIEFVLILALMGLVAFLYFDRLGTAAGEQASSTRRVAGGSVMQRPSIAVMPFINMSSASEGEYFGDGLAEEILNLLAKLEELDVAARTSSFYFKGKAMDIKAIGKKLGVEHILEGSVRLQDDKLRVTAQLINTETGFHLWTETYNRDLDDLFTLQDDIASKVTDKLQLILSPQSRDKLKSDLDVDPLAYDYYLRGRDFLRQPFDRAALQSALDWFTKSVEVSPQFASGYAGICDSVLGLYELNDTVTLFESAEKACHRALTLDSNAVPVYVALGNLYRNSGLYPRSVKEFNRAISLKGTSVDAYIGLAETQVAASDLALAEENFRRAIELQPFNWQAQRSMGNYLFTVGRIAEALPYYKRITQLLPQSESSLNNLGAVYYILGDAEQALVIWHQSLELSPTPTTYSNVGSSLFFMGEFEKSAQMYRKAIAQTPDDYEMWGNLGDAQRFYSSEEAHYKPVYLRAIELVGERLKINPIDAGALALLAHYHASLGNHEQSLQNIAKAQEAGPKNMYVFYPSATALVLLGQLDEAMAALATAVELGYPPELAKIDAGFRELLHTPKFQQLVHAADTTKTKKEG
ncbi:MAG: tetratricopeptide repeat protein [Proteobacteria bacterium]|nr:tetratricopeptide repeat protein [Pseudomonadota bacterium]